MLTLPAEFLDDLSHLEGVTSLNGGRFWPVFQEADSPECVYLIKSGLVKSSVVGADHKEIVLRILAGGYLMGVREVLLDVPRTTRAVSLTESSLMAIPGPSFLAYCEQKPGMWQTLAHMLAQYQIELHRKIQLLVLHDVEFRLLNALVELADICGPELPDTSIHSIPLSQEDLAVIIGATRETTSNKLNQMARNKLVILGRRRVIVPSTEALREALRSTSNATAS